MKKIVSLVLALTMLFCAFVLSSCDSNSGSNIDESNSGNNVKQSNTQKEEEFHNLVDETKELLDIVADDIYSYWYDCIYNDKYLENITYAVACAQSDNEANLNSIEENTTKINPINANI